MDINTNENISVNKSSGKREVGFELLRIISVFLITCVHMLNYGRFLSNTNSYFEFLSLKMIYCFFMTSVNAFVLISAYFLVNSKFKWKKLLRLWLEVVFYSLSLYLVSLIISGGGISFKALIECFFPIISRRYWFFTTYFLMYLISPLLNKILHNSSKKECYIYCLVILLFSFCARRFSIDDSLGLDNGGSLMWFVCLYIIAGTLRLYPIELKRSHWFLIYIASIMFLFVNIFNNTSIPAIGYITAKLEYTEPFVLIASVSQLMLFSRIEFKSTKINKAITFVSASTFGIYLFQDADYFKPLLYFKILEVSRFYSSNTSFLMVLVLALTICIMGLCFDLIRRFFDYVIKKICLTNTKSNA